MCSLALLYMLVQLSSDSLVPADISRQTLGIGDPRGGGCDMSYKMASAGALDLGCDIP